MLYYNQVNMATESKTNNEVEVTDDNLVPLFCIYMSDLPKYYATLSNYYHQLQKLHIQTHPLDNPDNLVLYRKICDPQTHKQSLESSRAGKIVYTPKTDTPLELNLFPPNTYISSTIVNMDELVELFRAAFDWQFTDLPHCVYKYIHNMSLKCVNDPSFNASFLKHLCDIQRNFKTEIECLRTQTMNSGENDVDGSRQIELNKWVDISINHRLSVVDRWFDQISCCMGTIYNNKLLLSVVENKYEQLLDYFLRHGYTYNCSDIGRAIRDNWTIGLDIFKFHWKCGNYYGNCYFNNGTVSQMSHTFNKIAAAYVVEMAKTGNLSGLQYIHKLNGALNGVCVNEWGIKVKHKLSYIAMCAFNGGHLDCIRYLYYQFNVLPNVLFGHSVKKSTVDLNACLKFVYEQDKTMREFGCEWVRVGIENSHIRPDSVNTDFLQHVLSKIKPLTCGSLCSHVDCDICHELKTNGPTQITSLIAQSQYPDLVEAVARNLLSAETDVPFVKELGVFELARNHKINHLQTIYAVVREKLYNNTTSNPPDISGSIESECNWLTDCLVQAEQEHMNLN